MNIDAIGLDGLLMLLEINAVIGLTLVAAPLWRPIRDKFRRIRAVIDGRQAVSLILQRGWPY